MRTGRCASMLAFVFPLLVAAPAVMAQARDQAPGYVGNWNVEFRDKDGKLLATGHFAIHPGPAAGTLGRTAGILKETAGPTHFKEYACQKGKFDGASIELGCDTYGYITHMDTVKLRLSDHNTMSGTWSRSNVDQGQVKWTRAKPAIDKVEVVREKPPYIRLRLRGRDLPLWIHVRAEPLITASIDDPNYRITRENLSVNDVKGRWEREVLEFLVELRPGALPGRKIITVNGSPQAFETAFAVEATRTARLVGLRYVELKEGKFVPIAGELKHGATFYVEAAFDAKPALPDYTVKLSWSGGPGAEVKVKPSDDAKLFRSEPIVLQPPAVNR